MVPLAIATASPNAAYAALAGLERLGVVCGVVTQNIDGLHQQAGSVRVCELHGHLREASCVDCADVVIRHDVAEVFPLVLSEVMCDE